MRILEMSRSCCRSDYAGNFSAMIAAGDGIIYDDERIRHAFNFGNGTPTDFRQYVENNRKYSRYYDLDSRAYI